MPKLKNGAEIDETRLKVYLLTLKALFDKNMIIFWKLVRKCRDSNYKMDEKTAAELMESGFLRTSSLLKAQPVEEVKNIILSAIEGEDLLTVKWGSPFETALPLEDKSTKIEKKVSPF